MAGQPAGRLRANASLANSFAHFAWSFQQRPGTLPPSASGRIPAVLEQQVASISALIYPGMVSDQASLEGMTSAEVATQLLDREAVERAQQGDTAAFAEIVQRYRNDVYAYLRTRLLQPTDADDLVQEVFLRCYQGMERFDSSRLMRPYLVGIARNLLRERARQLNSRKEVAWTELCLELDQDAAASDTQHEDADDRLYDDIIGHLPQCLKHLGSNAREALLLHYRSKLKLTEISERLERSVGAVKLLMYRARQSLKRCLDRQTSGAEDV